jgi:hypothetical protein
METYPLKVGNVSNVQMNDLKTHEEYIKLFTERRNRIIEKTGKRSFTMKEYLNLINEDKG